jgi:hypothetical protein
MAPRSGNRGVPGVPSLALLAQYGVNLDTWECIKQPLYDDAVYPAAGTTQLTFFQTQKGQGTSILGPGTKTYQDTNMLLNGQLSANTLYWLQQIELGFWPTTPSVTAQLPAVFGAQAAAQLVNDAYVFYRSGYLELSIGQKPYLDVAPLAEFPPQTDFAITNPALSDATTAAASSQSRIAYASVVGPPFSLWPANIMLQNNQNFSVTLNWGTAQALPSTNPAQVYCRFRGLLYRKAQ